MNYYNENDPQAAAWLRELIAQGALPDGVVDDRSIEDVTPIELEPYVQCHFFAGIGGWPYALQLAGWPEDRPVWTGSCPCQPFSAAGKGAGTADERHLWPAFFWLISQCRPAIVFGEQVASSDALGWWDVVSTDLEAADYACGAIDLCAAGVGAFHLRQRLYWVGTLVNTPSQGHQGRLQSSVGRERPWAISQRSGDVGVVADSESLGRGFLDSENKRATDGEKHPPSNDSQASSLADAGGQGLEVERQQQAWGQCQTLERGSQANPWQHPDWLSCRDGKARPTEPSIFPLVNGIPADLVCGSNPGIPANETAEARTMRLRGYGNAIVPQLAAQFITAVMGGK
jgi:DNA (cytosine-5)-methyltransferase 1